MAESLQRFDEIDVLGVVATSQDGLRRVVDLFPSVALLDATSPQSLEFLRSLSAIAADIRTVALALDESGPEIVEWVEAGVSGYVSCCASLTDAVAVIESVMRGEALCSPEVAGSLFRRIRLLSSNHRSPLPQARLTLREQEIVELIDAGLSNKEIAMRLSISLSTVKNHVHNILQKMDASRRGEAAAYARASARH
jgi:DNA-binding NarL/FixJ family response regulator